MAKKKTSVKVSVRKRPFDVWKKCVCVRVTIKKWGNRARHDPNDSKGIKTKADRDSLSVYKRLVQCDEYKAILLLDNAAKRYIHRRIFQSENVGGGVWLLPKELIESFDEYLSEYIENRETLVKEFSKVYRQRREEAKERLKDLWRPEDFPTIKGVKDKFSVQRSYFTYGDPGAAMPASTREREEAARKEMHAQFFAEARQALRESFAGLVDHMVEITKPGKGGRPKKFKRSSLDKWFEFLEMFGAKDLTDDTKLAKLVERAKKMLEKHQVNYRDLKDDESLRDIMNRGFAKIKSQADKAVEQKPARLIELDDTEDFNKQRKIDFE